ncbi:DUF3775 domain-containing protein [Rhodoblastus sp.]|uniref:DUF3775 domain-containing protein n=1 Tax=Rhodoblastus sp. TaxID=1962975 RepID=UPI003F9A5097
MIAKSRELLSEDVGVRRDDSNPTDDQFPVVLTDSGDRPARLELVEFICGLDADELNTLVALVWIGRGDFERAVSRVAVKRWQALRLSSGFAARASRRIS